MKKLLKLKFSLFILIIGLSACMNNYPPIPKEKAYHSIKYPPKSYQNYINIDCPYTFEYPVYANINNEVLFFNDKPSDPCWANID